MPTWTWATLQNSKVNTILFELHNLHTEFIVIANCNFLCTENPKKNVKNQCAAYRSPIIVFFFLHTFYRGGAHNYTKRGKTKDCDTKWKLKSFSVKVFHYISLVFSHDEHRQISIYNINIYIYTSFAQSTHLLAHTHIIIMQNWVWAYTCNKQNCILNKIREYTDNEFSVYGKMVSSSAFPYHLFPTLHFCVYMYIYPDYKKRICNFINYAGAGGKYPLY